QYKNLESHIESESYGAFSLVKINTFSEIDTLSSSYFVGSKSNPEICLYLCDFSDPLFYFGKVSLIGNQVLPQKKTEELYMKNIENHLVQRGEISVSERKLPLISNLIDDFIEREKGITL